jgi:CheY-like chemotaxis protein
MAMAKACILVVDDEADVLGTLEILLKLHGYQVMTASHGLHALQVLSSQRPYVIVTDITMPTMDGATLCGQLKSDSATADIPIIVCSGVDGLPAGLTKHVASFLQKPVDFEELDHRIRASLPSSFGDH